VLGLNLGSPDLGFHGASQRFEKLKNVSLDQNLFLYKSFPVVRLPITLPSKAQEKQERNL
jgi:hypothetical protein